MLEKASLSRHSVNGRTQGRESRGSEEVLCRPREEQIEKSSGRSMVGGGRKARVSGKEKSKQ